MPIKEMIHDVVLIDPYRWLEDRDRPETQAWISRQQAHYDTYFSRCDLLPVVRERVRAYLDNDVIDQPARVGERYFYRRRKRGQERCCIYVSGQSRIDETLLVDPSHRGSFVTVGIHRISTDGSLLAFDCRVGGEDRKSIHVLDVRTGIELSPVIPRGQARGLAFANDNEGLYFCQETSEEGEHVVQYQSLRDSRASRVVFRTPRSRNSRLLLLSDEHHLGALRLRETSGRRVQDLWLATHKNQNDWKQVFAGRNLSTSPILMDGKLFGMSCGGISEGELVQFDERGRSLGTIIPAQGRSVTGLVFAGESIFAQCSDCDGPIIEQWSKQGSRLHDLDVPPHGTVNLLPRLGTNESVFYSYESLAQPPTIFEYVLATRSSRVWYKPLLKCSAPETFVRKGLYASADGTDIPITLVSSRFVSDGSPSPVIMTAYGGFGVAVTPRFSVLASVMMEYGARFALPHVRGGGEFGKAWHHSARGRRKHITFQDFIAAAEWLVGEGLATTKQLGIFGGSNSGLLVGVAFTQRPDLFRAVLCISPLLDMLRYETLEGTGRWREEYGTSADKDDFHALLAYSPYHHVHRDVAYPSILFVTGDRDERCNPAHARKMAARLLDEPSQKNLVLVDHSDLRGHVPVLPLETRIEALARRLVFFIQELGLSLNEGDHHEAVRY